MRELPWLVELPPRPRFTLREEDATRRANGTGFRWLSAIFLLIGLVFIGLQVVQSTTVHVQAIVTGVTKIQDGSRRVALAYDTPSGSPVTSDYTTFRLLNEGDRISVGYAAVKPDIIVVAPGRTRLSAVLWGAVGFPVAGLVLGVWGWFVQRSERTAAQNIRKARAR